MQNVTTKKFSEMCSCSDTNIRMLISTGTLVAEKDEFGNYLIDVDNEKNAKYLQKKKKVAQPFDNVLNNISQSVNNGIPQELLATIVSIAEELRNNKEMFIKVGKYEQLESNIKEKEEDAQYWKNKYMELQQEKEKLLIKITQQEAELTQLKRKSFFGIKYGK